MIAFLEFFLKQTLLLIVRYIFVYTCMPFGKFSYYMFVEKVLKMHFNGNYKNITVYIYSDIFFEKNPSFLRKFSESQY